MGICSSSTGGSSRRRSAENEADDWWKEKDGKGKKKKKQKTSFDFKFKSSFSGGGGRGGSSEERALSQIPGRLLGSGSTAVASLFTQQGKKGTNQDSMIFWENFSSRSDTVFCGVFDGHGPYGHMVSRKVRDALPVLLCSEWKSHSNVDKSKNGNGTKSENVEETMDESWSGPLEVGDGEMLPETYLPLKQSILEAFKLMDKELKFHSVIDCFCSGTTAVTLVKQGQHIVIGNVGDSRAVLATRDEDNGLTAIQLTVDLKPNLPREAARIQQCKGRVFALQDEPEVARVWLPNSDSPGLAMARAFGDFCLKDFGLISVPDVYYRHLTERDEFIILASDGVWDVLSNKEAVDIVASAPSRATAARALVDCATRGWRLKYPTSKIDDCAVVCLFLEPQPPAEQKDTAKTTQEPAIRVPPTTPNPRSSDTEEASASSVCEIVPVVESKEEKQLTDKSLGQSTRSLAECLSTAEEDEWSALEGISRVNSLLSLPRFLSGGDKGSASWRKKWL